ncbi:MAG: hypothetical protein QOF94_2158 [Acidobacteriaceae bacterium]
MKLGASRHLQFLPDHVQYPPMGLRGRTACIHGHNALRLSCGDRQVAFVDAGEKRPILLLEAIFIGVLARTFAGIIIRTIRSALVAPLGSPHAHRRIGVQEDR